MPKPKYSIITVCSNGLQHTIKCVESIIACSKDYELIIVNNNSTDGTTGYLNDVCSGRENFKLIEHKDKLTFAENNNLGLQIVDGDYIIFLNNDIVVSKDWLERMEAHFHNVPLDNIGCVGPVSSSSNGRQMVGLQDPEIWYQNYKGSWSHAGILYGWCMMFKRHVIDEIGGFDERFVNSYEDNELGHRAQLAGYKLIIAKDVYIYHAGSATLKDMMTMDQYAKNGVENQKRYFDKYWDPTPKKLVAVYRTNWGRYLESSLAQTSKFADSIIIHFCRAPKDFPIEGALVDRDYKITELKKRFPKITHIEFYDGVFQEDYERGRLLELALEMHANGQADWCISIDDDEIYEDKFIEMAPKLMNPRNPEVMAYWCNWRTIWDTRLGVEYYRTDSTFGSFANYRFFRLMKNQKIISKHPEGHHCGSAPWFAEENLRWTNVRVKHLGYDTPEQRQKKFEFYEANDHFKTRADIGYDDYSHLISKNPSLEVYNSDNGISLVMMVKDEADLILGVLENFEYLVDEMIIVDTGSTDETLEIIKNFSDKAHVPVHVKFFRKEDGDNAKYFNEDGRLNNFSIPRNYGRSFAKNQWILFMDADERIRPEHIRDVMKYSETENDVVVFNVFNYLEKSNNPAKPPRTALTQAGRMFKNIPELFFNGLIHENADDSLAILSKKRKVRTLHAKVEIYHYGYLKDKVKVKAKLDGYEKLNLRQIEITEQMDARPYFNLALHYINDDRMQDALQMFQKALEINPRFWLCYQQMAALNIQNARSFLISLLKFMPAEHPLRRESETVLNFFNEKCKGFVKVN